MVDGVNYLYKSGEFIEPEQVGFDLTEATVARACVQDNVQHSVQAKREISKLWSDIDKPPYKLLFNGSIQGSTLYKEVKVLRQVEKQIKNKKSTTNAREKLFVTHGNRFLAYLVFKSLKENGKLYSDLSDDDVKAVFDQRYLELFNKIEELHPDAVLGSLFKNISKCRQIANDI